MAGTSKEWKLNAIGTAVYLGPKVDKHLSRVFKYKIHKCYITVQSNFVTAELSLMLKFFGLISGLLKFYTL